MTEAVERSVIEPANPKLNVSRNANLPHSPGIRVSDYIFLSGMGPVDPVSGGRNLGPIAEQIRQTLRNMAHMLESAGSGLDRILKMTVVLADAGDYDEMNRVWREFFPVDLPARTACALQLSNGIGVEIECIALAGRSGEAPPRVLEPAVTEVWTMKLTELDYNEKKSEPKLANSRLDNSESPTFIPVPANAIISAKEPFT
jgi:2-iminobutanoate/2-iminopropanoate deaminase